MCLWGVRRGSVCVFVVLGVGRANVCVCVGGGGGGLVHACEGWVGCIDVCV